MDRPTREALDRLAEVVAERPLEGPVVLSEAYLRNVERVERLSCNRRGTDKSWTEHLLEDWTEAVARARRRPVE